MPGIIPETTSGALTVRDIDGVPIPQPTVFNGYVPSATFVATCAIQYLPAGCEARITAEQINAFQSEMLCLAEKFDPTGPWNCSALCNLSTAFQTWIDTTLPGMIGDELCDSPEGDADGPNDRLIYCDGEGNIRKYSGSVGMFVQSVNSIGPDGDGNVEITGDQIPVHVGGSESIGAAIDDIRTDLVGVIPPRPPETYTVGGVTQSVNIPAPATQKDLIDVYLDGAHQAPSQYALAANVLTPVGGAWDATGAGNMVVTFKAVTATALTTPADGSVTIPKLANDVLNLINNATTASFMFDNWAAVQAAAIPLAVISIRVNGHTNPGIGGAWFKRALVMPTHALSIQDISGNWWEIAELAITSDMFGLLGNSTDETARIQQFLDAFGVLSGKEMHWKDSGIFGYEIATGLVWPSNGTRVFTHRAKFKRLTSRSGTIFDSDYNFVINGNIYFDRLAIEANGGPGDIGGLYIPGSNVTIDELAMNALTVGTAANGGAWVGFRIGPNSGVHSENVNIGVIKMINFDRAAEFNRVDNSSIAFIDVEMYRRGVYVNNCIDFTINGGRIHTMSPNSIGVAGDNGLLMGCSDGHFQLKNVYINNLVVEDAGEHGFRVGGAFIAQNIHHTNCMAIRTGSGTAATGGCGFKFLGPTGTYGTRHQDFYYTDCTVLDMQLPVATTGYNYDGFQCGKGYNIHLTNPSVRSSLVSGSYAPPVNNSCLQGIGIIGCEKLTVTGMNIVKAAQYSVHVYDSNADFLPGQPADWGISSDIHVSGGISIDPGEAHFGVVPHYTAFRRFTFEGTKVTNGPCAIVCDTVGPGSTGGMTATLDVVMGGATEILTGCDNWTVNMRGDFIGANACRNGSIYQDVTNSQFKQRKLGAWSVIA